mmetsp:Transcript_57629/g.187213  ORF Transcript_57629/g.187213 Transcript_57629/m.187213 type:complete len:283 (+) Transcript_57629:862-1710(+)
MRAGRQTTPRTSDGVGGALGRGSQLGDPAQHAEAMDQVVEAQFRPRDQRPTEAAAQQRRAGAAGDVATPAATSTSSCAGGLRGACTAVHQSLHKDCQRTAGGRVEGLRKDWHGQLLKQHVHTLQEVVRGWVWRLERQQDPQHLPAEGLPQACRPRGCRRPWGADGTWRHNRRVPGTGPGLAEGVASGRSSRAVLPEQFHDPSKAPELRRGQRRRGASTGAGRGGRRGGGLRLLRRRRRRRALEASERLLQRGLAIRTCRVRACAAFQQGLDDLPSRISSHST